MLENIEIIESEYDSGVNLIRQFKDKLALKESDLEFASALLKQPLGERWEWLEEKISDKMKLNGTIEQWQDLMTELEAIRSWVPKNQKAES